MNPVSLFIVLIECRRRSALPWKLATLTLLAGLLGSTASQAQPFGADRHVKVARDLDAELIETKPSKARWARELNGVRHVQVVVVSNSTDPQLADLRAYVLRTGGSVHAVHPAFRAMTVQIKAGQVRALAQRPDVVSVSPNRVTQRTASTLEAITGSLTVNVRSNSTKTSYDGLGGTGVGIAVLDSGVMKAHEGFLNDDGNIRVKRNVDMLNASLANWTLGIAGTASLAPGSSALSGYESAIANDSNLIQDPNGHGTHVASGAAGRARYYK